MVGGRMNRLSNDPIRGTVRIVKKTIDSGVNAAKAGPRIILNSTRDKAHNVVDTTRRIVYNTIATLCTFVLIISLSVFLYGSFYYAYMPLEMHEASINLQFDPCEDKNGMCSYPNASVDLSKQNQLMIGQPYSISLLLEVPDSVNNQDVGMFMSCLSAVSGEKVVKSSCKSAMLEFRSELLRMIETFVFSPFLLSGTTTQRQWLKITYFSNFMDDPHATATHLRVQLQSKFIEVYSSKVMIHAEFSGLRHIMYHHPWISSTAGILSNILVLSVIILISWTRFFTPDLTGLDDFDSGLTGEISDQIPKQRRRSRRARL